MKRILCLFLACIPYYLYAQTTVGTLNNLHQVEKGETLYSIARQYGITQEALMRSNPEETKKGKVKRGSFLVIPPAEPQPQVVAVETTPVIEPQKAESYDTVKVGVLLPFEEKTPQADKMVEFYRGILMAVDSIRRTGVSVEVHAMHSGHTAEDIHKALETGSMNGLHVIFGPADNAQTPVLADYCRGLNTRLVLPFQNTQPAAGFPLQYTATSSNMILQREAARLVMNHFGDCNFVLLKTGSPDQKGESFIGQMTGQLEGKGVAMRVLALDGDEMAYEGALNQFRRNVIIPDNTGIKSLTVLYSRLNDFAASHPEFKLSLLGYPEWQTYTNQLPREFYRYDTYFYTSYFRNPLSKSTSDFENLYQSDFRAPMAVSFPRYGMMGYDMGLFFISGLAKRGDNFERYVPEMRLQPVQHPFRFVGGSDEEGFTNRAVQLVHYTPQQTIEQIQ